VGVLVLLGAGPVSAKSGFYIGGSFGQTTLKIDDLDLDLEQFDFSDSDTSYKIIAGYRFMGFFAVEASYLDFGSLADSVDTIEGTVGIRTDLKGFDAVAMGMLPLGLADLFAKAGFVSWDADIRTAFGEIVELDSDSGTDMVYGIGAQLRFRGLAVRAEVEYFDIADADSVYLVSLGATFTF
jgi:OOP family OmpA-OmpF porin